MDARAVPVTIDRTSAEVSLSGALRSGCGTEYPSHPCPQLLLSGVGGAKTEETFRETFIPLMFGFGDDEQPLRETAELLQEICVDYIIDLCAQARDSVSPGEEVTATDFLFALRKDPAKYTRAVQKVERGLIVVHESSQAKKKATATAYQDAK